MSTTERQDPNEPEPGGRVPAPGRLRLVQLYVNTNDREGGHDLLIDPDALANWCRENTVWPDSAKATTTELRQALVIREGLRELARHDRAFGGPQPVDADFADGVAALDVRVVVTPHGLGFSSGRRLGRALAPLLAAIRAAMDDGTWQRLKVCQRDKCQWLYYDNSRNNSSRWCATSICGSREKARRAYRRRREDATTDS